MKKPIENLLRQIKDAHKGNLLLGYVYDPTNRHLAIQFCRGSNMPIQTLVKHIETCYPIRDIQVLHCDGSVLITMKVNDSIVLTKRSPEFCLSSGAHTGSI